MEEEDEEDFVFFSRTSSMMAIVRRGFNLKAKVKSMPLKKAQLVREQLLS